jgi:hypothetical protein
MSFRLILVPPSIQFCGNIAIQPSAEGLNKWRRRLRSESISLKALCELINILGTWKYFRVSFGNLALFEKGAKFAMFELVKLNATFETYTKLFHILVL